MADVAPAGLVRMIGAVAPYWGAEAEVCRAYFESPARTLITDLGWLARQAAKELVDGVVMRAEQLARLIDSGDAASDSALLTRTTEELHEEALHYAAFAAAHDAIRPADAPPLSGDAVGHEVAWPENVELREVRARHEREHGSLGRLASLVTEGGYCRLFAEGAARAGGSAADDAVATACALVLEDEYDHMIAGIAGLRDAGLSDDEWDLLADLAVEQSRVRVRMRNAQFGHPVAATRIDELLAGAGTPIAFDWGRAGFGPPGGDDR
jgi:hypothetical protein